MSIKTTTLYTKHLKNSLLKYQPFSDSKQNWHKPQYLIHNQHSKSPDNNKQQGAKHLPTHRVCCNLPHVSLLDFTFFVRYLNIIELVCFIY